MLKKISYFLWFLAALALLVFLPSMPPAHAADVPEDIKISANLAKPAFPTSIEFQLSAKSLSGKRYARAELYYKLVGGIATRVRSLNLPDNGTDIEASISIDTQKDFIPPGVGIRYYWTVYDAAGTSFDTPSQEFTLKDERFGFHEISSGMITVRWFEGSDSFGKAILDKAQATVSKLTQLYNIKVDNPINIHIYPDQRTLYQALPPNTGEFVGGQAYPEFGAISLEIPPGNLTEVGRSVPHEVSHLVVYQATRNPYNRPPLWLDEGLAVNNQDQVEGFLQEAFQRGVDKRTLQSLRALGGPFPTDATMFYQSYGESVKFVQYLLKTYGQDKMGQLLNIFRTGVSYDEALMAVFGKNTDELDREWKESIGYPLPPLQAPQPTATPEITAGVTTPAATPPATTPKVNPVVTTPPAVAPTPTPIFTGEGPAATSAANLVSTAQAALTASSTQRPASAVTSTGSNSWSLALIAGGLGLVVVAGISLFLWQRKR